MEAETVRVGMYKVTFRPGPNTQVQYSNDVRIIVEIPARTNPEAVQLAILVLKQVNLNSLLVHGTEYKSP